MLPDDPRVQAGLFGVALPGLIGLVCMLPAVLVARRGKRQAGDAASSGTRAHSRAGYGPALGLGLAYVAASVGLLGMPDNWPRSTTEWLAPLILLGTLLIALPDLVGPIGTRRLAVWLGRAGFAAAVLVWPIANTRANRWEGSELWLWHAGIGLWLLLAFACMDRVSAKLSPVFTAVVVGLTVVGLIPVVFGAGVTSHPQVSGGMGAAIGAVGVVTILTRGIVPLRGAASLLVVWLTMTLLVSYQFIANMAWWEFGVVASLPLVLATLTILPKIGKLNSNKLGWIAVVITVGLTAAVSGQHVPGLIAELTGSGGSSIDDYYGY